MKFLNMSVFIFALGTFTCSAQSPAWNGTWNLVSISPDDTGKPTITFSQNSDGTYALRSSSTAFQFRCDHKPYPVWSQLTGKASSYGVCNLQKNGFLDVTFNHPYDKNTTAERFEVSSDERSLVSVSFPSDATKKEQIRTTHYTRVSGSHGLLGGWRDSDPNPSRVLRVVVSRSDITLDFPFGYQTAVLPLSGNAVHVTNHGTPTKGTQALRMESSNRFHILDRDAAGIVLKEIVFSLSPDGNTITEEGWQEQHPDKRGIYLYHRSR